MNLNLLSKNNMGVAATLVLVIALSQSRAFDFLIDTALGRSFLIILILGISYVNKIFGVIAILFIIIMFNQSDIGFMEGFTENSPNIKGVVKQKDIDTAKKQTIQNIQTQKSATSSSTTPTTTSTTSTTTSDTFIGGREGFNIIDREGSMLKGKKSNEVPVFSNARNQTEDIEPSDKSVFTSDFSTF